MADDRSKMTDKNRPISSLPEIPRIRDVSLHSEQIFERYCDIVTKMKVNLDHKCPIEVPSLSNLHQNNFSVLVSFQENFLIPV